MTQSFITPGHVRAMSGPISCRINGEAGVAIVLMDHVSARARSALFVAITSGMDIVYEGEGTGGEAGGGGPKRSAKQDFAVNADMATGPHPS